MKRISKVTLFVLAIIVLLLFTPWATLALWYRLPLPETIRMVISGLFALFSLTVAISVFRPRPIKMLGAYAVSMAAILLWWGTLTPPTDANWTPKVSMQATGQIEGDILTMQNVREFVWRTQEDYDQIWTSRTYDLRQIQSVDAFMSYWGPPEIAHLIVSFGFAEGPNLAWSVEIRSEIGGEFHPVPDFFRTHALVYIASVEQDVVGLRSNLRDHDVQLFRLRLQPDLARKLLEELVHDATTLAKQPAFFHSFTTNCTTVVFRKMRGLGMDLPWDWRVIVNGFFPDYLYDQGLLTDHMPLSELRNLGRINTRTNAVGLNDGFSAAARQGVPVANE